MVPFTDTFTSTLLSEMSTDAIPLLVKFLDNTGGTPILTHGKDRPVQLNLRLSSGLRLIGHDRGNGSL